MLESDYLGNGEMQYFDPSLRAISGNMATLENIFVGGGVTLNIVPMSYNYAQNHIKR